MEEEKTDVTMNRVISIAIPHYNNAQYIMDAIGMCIRDNRVNEIVICDDCSSDIAELEKILKQFTCISNKIRLFKNERNLGCFHNKLNAVAKCTNEWAILLDADNILQTDYIDRLFEFPEWNNRLIYHPCWAKVFPTRPGVPIENMDFRMYEKQSITPSIFLAEFEKKQNAKFHCLLNNCNYFLPVSHFLKCMREQGDKFMFVREKMDILDSTTLFVNWLCNGNEVYVVENLTYQHRIHNRSNYAVSPSRTYRDEVIRQLYDRIVGYVETEK